MIISYRTHIQNEGWNIPVVNGATSGTVGLGLRMEAIEISLLDKGGLDVAMEYQSHVENIGWQTPLKTDGQTSGTVGQGLRLEALRIRLTGADAKKYTVKYRVHVENLGWLLWCKDGETAGTEGVALRAEAIEIRIELVKTDVIVTPPTTDPTVDPTKKLIQNIPPEKILCASYATHVEGIGWLDDVTDGRLSGRVGQGKRMEAIRISLLNTGSLNLGVAYATHVENQGWLPEVSNGVTSGTTDQGLRMEAIKMHLTGTDANLYSIWYRVHVQNEAWQEWRRDGEIAGTAGQALRAEAIQIIITLKSQNIVRSPGQEPLICVNYRTHIQNLAWGAWVKNGLKSGNTDLGLRMEALEIKLSSLDSLGIGVTYRTHVQNQGWQSWVSDGKTSGTTGLGLRVEAIEIKLTGVDASLYTIKYRGYIEGSGWSAWKQNGQTLGTTGLALMAEAISIVLVKNSSTNGTITNEVKNRVPYLQIWASEFPKADVLLHDIRLGYHILEPEFGRGKNKSSSFTFKIDPTHVNYSSIRKMATTILAYDIDSNMEKTLKFEGRVLSDVEDIDGIREVTCEGELSYLLDSIQRPATYENVTPEQWMTMVLDNHNMQVTSDKRIYMGICTVLGNDGTGTALGVSYRTHIENQAWLTWVKNGEKSGTTGQGLRMEALEIKLESLGAVNLGITYRVHIQDQGWQDWVSDGATAGSVGQGLRVEAVEIKLTGENAGEYSVEYRVHVENDGWQDWQADGGTAGTTGQGYRLEAIVIIITSKTGTTASVLKDTIFRENEYIQTLELIKTTMLDTLGGVLTIERIGGLRFLNYLENYGVINNQPIMFGLNMLDYNKTLNASGIITALVPYGKEIDGKKLDISSVNSDCDFIYDEVAVNAHGWITGTKEWPNISSASALKVAATNYLNTQLIENVSMELTAIDLHKINIDIQTLEVGDMVPVISEKHGINTYLEITKKKEFPENPSKDTVTLGGASQSLTDRISGPLGGGTSGSIMTANSVKNMEYVSNELSFMVKITSEKMTATENTVNEALLSINAESIIATVTSSTTYTNDMASKAPLSDISSINDDLGSLTSRVSTAESKITATAIVSTVTSSTTYTNAMTGKVNKVTAISEINQSAEGIKISAGFIDFTGMATFTQAQTLANTAQTNATNSATTLASTARSGAVSDIKTGLASTNYTAIHGGNLTTGTITCDKISGGTLNFNTISCSGYIQLVSSSTNAGMAFQHSTSGKYGGVYATSSYGANLYSGSGGILIDPTTGYTKINSLYANNQPYNIPMTRTEAAYKITELAQFTDGNYYLNVSCNGTNKGVYLPISDGRLKMNIRDSSKKALVEINKFRIREYDWIENAKHADFGFIAQETERDVSIDYIGKIKQPDGTVSYQMKDFMFSPLLVKAIQELHLEFTEYKLKQQNEIAMLKYQIQELKGGTIC